MRPSILRTILFFASLVPLAACSSDDGGDGGHGGTDATDVVTKGCDQNSDCPGGRCVEGLPGGLCTANCAHHEDCPEGTLCIDTEAVQGICLFPCPDEGTCGDLVGSGYVCDTETDIETDADRRVCIDE